MHWVHHCNYTYFGVQLEVPDIAVEHNMNSRLQYVANLLLRNQQFFCTQEWGGVSAPKNGEVCRLTSDYTAEMPALLRDVEGEGLEIEQNCLLGAGHLNQLYS